MNESFALKVETIHHYHLVVVDALMVQNQAIYVAFLSSCHLLAFYGQMVENQQDAKCHTKVWSLPICRTDSNSKEMEQHLPPEATALAFDQ